MATDGDVKAPGDEIARANTLPIGTRVTLVAPVDTARAQRACLVQVGGGGRGSRVTLRDEDEVTLGRGDQADVVVGDDSVSKQHCRIVWEGQRHKVVDLGSTNGTFVNDERLDGERVLEDGDFVSAAKAVFKYFVGDEAEVSYYEELYRLQSHDALTGVSNRRHFLGGLERALGQRGAEPLALLLCGIDNMREINAQHGAAAGDELLRRVARVLEASSSGAEMGRYSGDVFAVLSVGRTEQATRTFAETLRRAVADEGYDEITADVRVSIGVGSVVEGGGEASVSALVEAADYALVRAKSTGRDRVAMVPCAASEPEAKRTTGQMTRLSPALMLRVQVAKRLQKLDGQHAVLVGACMLRQQDTLLDEHGRAVLHRCRDATTTAIDAALPDSVLTRDGGLYLYVATVPRDADVDALRQRIDEQMAASLADVDELSLAPSLAHGFALAETASVAVEELVRVASENLEVGAEAETEELRGWPFPVARALSQAMLAETDFAALEAMRSATAVCVRLVANVALAGLAQGARDERIGEAKSAELWRHLAMAKVSTASLIEICAISLAEARRHGWPLLGDLAASLLPAEGTDGDKAGGDAGADEAGGAVDGLSAARRLADYQAPVPASADEADPDASIAAQLAELRPLFDVFVGALAPLRQMRLASVTGINKQRDGTFRCAIRDHTGADPLFAKESLVLDEALYDGTYLLAREGAARLELSPLLRFADCWECRHQELAWIADMRVTSHTEYEGIATRHRIEVDQSVDEMPAILVRAPSSQALSVLSTVEVKLD